MTNITQRAGTQTHTKRAAKPRLWSLLTIILLVAALVRLYDLPTLPWGLSQDEAMNGNLARQAEFQYLPFMAGGFGHEPFFHHLQSTAIRALDDNALAIRLPAAYCGFLLVALGYSLTRRLAGRTAALVTAGGLAVSWWPIIYSRIGLRAVSFPLLLCLAIYALWRGLEQRLRPLCLLSGLLFGLSFYTYTAARMITVWALMWLLYWVLFQRKSLRRDWRILLSVAVIAGTAALPLFVYLRLHPEFQERISQMGNVLSALKQGELRPIAEATLATLGMFSLNAESRWTYGIPGRPLLGPVSGVLFYLGVVSCIIRLRRPAHGLLITWLGVMLLPGMVSPDAPTTIRTIGALPATFALIGVGAAWVAGWLRKVSGKALRTCAAIGLAAVGMAHLGWTCWDGLHTWAAHPEIYWRYKAHFADIALFIDRQSHYVPVVIFETWVDQIDLDGLQRDLRNDARWSRWTQEGQAYIWPVSYPQFVVAVPAFTTIDPYIQERFLDGAQVIFQSERTLNGRPGVTFYLGSRESLDGGFAEAFWHAPVTLPERSEELSLPLSFDDQIVLLGYEIINQPDVGEELRVLTAWGVRQDNPDSLALFLHLLDQDGALASQDDGIDVWTGTLLRGDVFVQLHTISTEGLEPSTYGLQLGAYYRGNSERLPIRVSDAVESDRLWLSTVTITP